MRRRRGVRAAGTPARAYRRGRAMHVSNDYDYSATCTTYVLGILFSKRAKLGRPPQVTREVDGTALIWLLQQLATVERAFCDECVVIFFAEVSCGV